MSSSEYVLHYYIRKSHKLVLLIFRLQRIIRIVFQMHLTRVYYSTQLFTKHLSSLRRLLQITLNNSFFFDLGSYMLLHLSLERIFLAKERPVFLIKPIWKRLSLIIRCMYVLLSEMHFVEGYNSMFFRENGFFQLFSLF